MAKPNPERQPSDEKPSPPPATAAWGTSEELLLAYAVNRYGTNNWNSISSELQKRTSAANLFTPENCKQKYLQLERRFNRSIGDDDSATAIATGDDVPWIEELRKLRVEELQQKLQKIDLYISSLQLKVKKLSEEDTENGYGGTKKSPDLGQKIDDEIEIKNEKEEEEQVNRNPVNSGEKQVSGDAGNSGNSGDDDQSVNGSNGNLETGEKSVNGKPESSFDGGPDVEEPVKCEPDRGEPESVCKENSDVQSSASKSRKERSDTVRRGTSKVDEPADEDEPYDGVPVRSLPLIDVLKKVHQLGSAVFERRLDRQEKVRYKKLIREHIDFEILQTRLKQGLYSDGNNSFFRDLLLLVNNTSIFFSNESPQSVAAIELRKFILNEMTSTRKQKTDPKSKPTILPPKQTPEVKPKLAGSMAVCRKRSSIVAKSSGRKEQMDAMNSSNKKESETKRISDGFSPILKKNSKTSKNVDGGIDDLQSRSFGSENSDLKSDAKKMKNKKSVLEKEEKRLSSSGANNLAAARGGSEDEGKKDEGVKRRSGGRQLDSPGKRNLGRPPKKAAPQPPAVAGLRKRNTDCAEGEPSVSKQAKKRTKRLY